MNEEVDNLELSPEEMDALLSGEFAGVVEALQAELPDEVAPLSDARREAILAEALAPVAEPPPVIETNWFRQQLPLLVAAMVVLGASVAYIIVDKPRVTETARAPMDSAEGAIEPLPEAGEEMEEELASAPAMPTMVAPDASPAPAPEPTVMEQPPAKPQVDEIAVADPVADIVVAPLAANAIEADLAPAAGEAGDLVTLVEAAETERVQESVTAEALDAFGGNVEDDLDDAPMPAAESVVAAAAFSDVLEEEAPAGNPAPKRRRDDLNTKAAVRMAANSARKVATPPALEKSAPAAAAPAAPEAPKPLALAGGEAAVQQAAPRAKMGVAARAGQVRFEHAPSPRFPDRLLLVVFAPNTKTVFDAELVQAHRQLSPGVFEVTLKAGVTRGAFATVLAGEVSVPVAIEAGISAFDQASAAYKLAVLKALDIEPQQQLDGANLQLQEK